MLFLLFLFTTTFLFLWGGAIFMQLGWDAGKVLRPLFLLGITIVFTACIYFLVSRDIGGITEVVFVIYSVVGMLAMWMARAYTWIEIVWRSRKKT